MNRQQCQLNRVCPLMHISLRRMIPGGQQKRDFVVIDFIECPIAMLTHWAYPTVDTRIPGETRGKDEISVTTGATPRRIGENLRIRFSDLFCDHAQPQQVPVAALPLFGLFHQRSVAPNGT